MPIPRPFEYPQPEAKPIDAPLPIKTTTIDATIVEIYFANDKAEFTIFEGDRYDSNSVCIFIEYAENPAVGRFEEKFMIFNSHVLYISERKVKMEIPVPKFIPSAAQSQVVAVPSAADQSN